MPERPATVADLVAAGRLRSQEPDQNALREMLDLADLDLEAAALNENRFAPWSETMLYEAGLRAARVIVMAAGFRIAAERGHVTAIDAADALTDVNTIESSFDSIGCAVAATSSCTRRRQIRACRNSRPRVTMC